MRGRKPLPKNVHILQGNASKLPRHELRPENGPPVEIPSPPAHLVGEALAEWARITEELAALGLVAAVDRAGLTLYCEAWATFVRAGEEIARLDGDLVVTHPNGFKGPSPWLAIRDKAAEQCRRMLAEFGMSPSSRTRVRATGQQMDLFEDPRNTGYFS